MKRIIAEVLISYSAFFLAGCSASSATDFQSLENAGKDAVQQVTSSEFKVQDISKFEENQCTIAIHDEQHILAARC